MDFVLHLHAAAYDQRKVPLQDGADEKLDGQTVDKTPFQNLLLPIVHRNS